MITPSNPEIQRKERLHSWPKRLAVQHQGLDTIVERAYSYVRFCLFGQGVKADRVLRTVAFLDESALSGGSTNMALLLLPNVEHRSTRSGNTHEETLHDSGAVTVMALAGTSDTFVDGYRTREPRGSMGLSVDIKSDFK
jgi:hypothetical protein